MGGPEQAERKPETPTAISEGSSHFSYWNPICELRSPHSQNLKFPVTPPGSSAEQGGGLSVHSEPCGISTAPAGSPEPRQRSAPAPAARRTGRASLPHPEWRAQPAEPCGEGRLRASRRRARRGRPGPRACGSGGHERRGGGGEGGRTRAGVGCVRGGRARGGRVAPLCSGFESNGCVTV